MKTFNEWLNEASFELGGKTYSVNWGKYKCDGEAITRQEYLDARKEYDRKDVKAAMGDKASSGSMKRIANYPDLNDDQDELKLFGDNDRTLYRQQQDIEKNLLAKVKKGTYDSEKAVKLWQYWADAAAKKYEKDFGTPGSSIFSKQDRKMVAIAKAKDFEDDNLDEE